MHIEKEDLVRPFDRTVKSFEEFDTVCFITIFATYLDL